MTAPSFARRPIAVATLLIGVLSVATCTPDRRTSDFRIVGYVFGGRGSPPAHVDAARLTHVNYAFTKIHDGEVLPPTPADTVNLAYLRSVRTENPDFQILISVGGWGGSEGFSDAALTQENRDRFARSAVRYMVENGLDGVDLDWEYPGQPGAGNTFRPEDRENFTLMLRSLRDHLDREKRQHSRDRPYLLTIATGASQTYLDNTDLRNAQRYLDFVNIMTYDYAGAWTDTVWHHTNLRAPTGPGASRRGTDLAVDQHLRAGVPRHKLVVGVAFYGRGWKDVDGLNRPASDSVFGLPYHGITELERSDSSFVRKWDEDALSPYLWSQSKRAFISYDDTVSLRLKSEFIRDEGLGGAMYWENSADTTGALLTTLHHYLREIPNQFGE